MKSGRGLLAVAFMFLALAAGLSIVVWQDAPLAATVGLFALGFGCGVTTGLWVGRRTG